MLLSEHSIIQKEIKFVHVEFLVTHCRNKETSLKLHFTLNRSPQRENLFARLLFPELPDRLSKNRCLSEPLFNFFYLSLNTQARRDSSECPLIRNLKPIALGLMNAEFSGSIPESSGTLAEASGTFARRDFPAEVKCSQLWDSFRAESSQQI